MIIHLPYAMDFDFFKKLRFQEEYGSIPSYMYIESMEWLNIVLSVESLQLMAVRAGQYVMIKLEVTDHVIKEEIQVQSKKGYNKIIISTPVNEEQRKRILGMYGIEYSGQFKNGDTSTLLAMKQIFDRKGYEYFSKYSPELVRRKNEDDLKVKIQFNQNGFYAIVPHSYEEIDENNYESTIQGVRSKILAKEVEAVLKAARIELLFK